MESGQNDDSNSSSEETHQQDDTAGTGRSYECVFCKRGFTTAQALGGHMNIHRKDRAGRTKPTSSAPSKPHDVDYANPRFHQPVFPSHVPNFEYQMYFPASTSTTRSQQYGLQNNDFPVPNPQFNHLNLFREDWPTSLSLHSIPNHAEDAEKKRRGSSEEEEDREEEELDLELRLGHNP